MPIAQNIVKRDGIAAGAIPPYRMIIQSAAGDQMVVAADGSVPIAGVSPGGVHDQDTVNAADEGDQFEFYAGGMVPVEADGAISVGDLVTAGTGGKASATPPAAGDHYLGFALTEATADQDVIIVQIDRGFVAA